MDIKKIITNYLILNSSVGLCKDECSCTLPNIIPCNENISDCEPGYIIKECTCEGECKKYKKCATHIGPFKNKTEVKV